MKILYFNKLFLSNKSFKPKAFFENVHGFIYKPHRAALEYLEESKKLGYNILIKLSIVLIMVSLKFDKDLYA